MTSSTVAAATISCLAAAAIHRLNGGTGSDVIAGGTGSDRLTGAAGKDEMTGGSGADRFIFLNIADSQVQALRDVITDFEQGSDSRSVCH